MGVRAGVGAHLGGGQKVTVVGNLRSESCLRAPCTQHCTALHCTDHRLAGCLCTQLLSLVSGPALFAAHFPPSHLSSPPSLHLPSFPSASHFSSPPLTSSLLIPSTVKIQFSRRHSPCRFLRPFLQRFRFLTSHSRVLFLLQGPSTHNTKIFHGPQLDLCFSGKASVLVVGLYSTTHIFFRRRNCLRLP